MSLIYRVLLSNQQLVDIECSLLVIAYGCLEFRDTRGDATQAIAAGHWISFNRKDAELTHYDTEHFTVPPR